MSPISIDSVIQAYGLYAPMYDKLFGAVLEPGRRALTKKVRAIQPTRILEMGVGTGLTLGQYPSDAAVVGIDISAEMLRRAHDRLGALPGRDIRLHTMNAEALAFPDDSFDCVTLPYVLSVTPNPARLIYETRRVCRKGGTIIVLNHFSGSRFWWLLEQAVKPIADRIGFRSSFRYDDHILAHDWIVESVTTVNFFGLSKLVAIRNV